jgi:hypothetical protein
MEFICYIFSPLLGWSGTESTITEATTGLLYHLQMMDDDGCGAIGGMLGRGNQSTRRKPTPGPICPPQIPHNLIRGSNPGCRGGKPLNCWATTRPLLHLTTIYFPGIGYSLTATYRFMLQKKVVDKWIRYCSLQLIFHSAPNIKIK